MDHSIITLSVDFRVILITNTNRRHFGGIFGSDGHTRTRADKSLTVYTKPFFFLLHPASKDIKTIAELETLPQL